MQRFIDLLMHTKQLYTLWPPMMMITFIPMHCCSLGHYTPPRFIV